MKAQQPQSVNSARLNERKPKPFCFLVKEPRFSEKALALVPFSGLDIVSGYARKQDAL